MVKENRGGTRKNAGAKLRRSFLTPGERGYYGMSYIVKKVKEKVA